MPGPEKGGDRRKQLGSRGDQETLLIPEKDGKGKKMRGPEGGVRTRAACPQNPERNQGKKQTDRRFPPGDWETKLSSKRINTVGRSRASKNTPKKTVKKLTNIAKTCGGEKQTSRRTYNANWGGRWVGAHNSFPHHFQKQDLAGHGGRTMFGFGQKGVVECLE